MTGSRRCEVHRIVSRKRRQAVDKLSHAELLPLACVALTHAAAGRFKGGLAAYQT
jgi:hypothetical protein